MASRASRWKRWPLRSAPYTGWLLPPLSSHSGGGSGGPEADPTKPLLIGVALLCFVGSAGSFYLAVSHDPNTKGDEELLKRGEYVRKSHSYCYVTFLSK